MLFSIFLPFSGKNKIKSKGELRLSPQIEFWNIFSNHIIIFINKSVFNQGLNTLLVPMVWKFYFFLPRVWKITKLVLMVLKSDQVSPFVS
jgi:hypothetical protein